jgi:enoyl-CoA hydratase
MSDPVKFEKLEGHVAVVTLDRPEKRNAVNGAVARGLDAAVKRAEADPDIWVVILTSSNDRVFCAGADLAEVAAGNGSALYTKDGGFAGFVYHQRSKPWIAAAKGATVAGGLELCLACDMIVAADSCTFGLPEVKRSLVAGAGGVIRLPKAIPLAVAMEMIATGDTISAERAYALGLVNRVVPVEQTLDAAIALAGAIAANAPLAVREALAVAKRAPDLTDAEGRHLAEQAMARIMATEDFQEGPRAFVEKRPAQWKGR